MNALDLFDLRSCLSEEEQLVQDSVARLVDARVLPIIQECFENHRFPRELVPELAALGLLGASLEGYGCAGLNSIASGLICQELEPPPVSQRNCSGRSSAPNTDRKSVV